MAVEKMLENDDHNDELEDQPDHASSKKKTRALGTSGTVWRKRGRESKQEIQGIETSSNEKSASVTAVESLIQIEEKADVRNGTVNCNHKKLKESIVAEASAPVAKRKLSLKQHEMTALLPSSDKDQRIESGSENEITPISENKQDNDARKKKLYLTGEEDVGSLLLIDKILAIRMKSSVRGAAQSIKEFTNIPSVISDATAAAVSSTAAVDSASISGQPDSMSGNKSNVVVDSNSKSGVFTDKELKVEAEADCGVKMDSIQWPSDSEEDGESSSDGASPAAPVILVATSTEVDNRIKDCGLNATNSQNISDSVHEITTLKKIEDKNEDDNEGKITLTESNREFLVKYFGKSYRALVWVDEAVIKSTETGENKLKGFLRVFKRKGIDPLPAVTADSEPFTLESIVDFDWLEIERIVAIFEEVIGAPGSINKHPHINENISNDCDKDNMSKKKKNRSKSNGGEDKKRLKVKQQRLHLSNGVDWVMQNVHGSLGLKYRMKKYL